MESFLETKIKGIKKIHKGFLYFLLGALWSFSQVGYSFAFLPWFTFIPFLFMIKYENYKSGFFYSWIFGSSVYLFHLWWLTYPVAMSLNIDLFPSYLGFLGWIIGIILYLITCIYHGLFYGLIFMLIKYVSKNDIYIYYLSVPLVVTALDVFFPKLWRDQLGYSQYVFFHFSQIVDVLGVPFITLLIISCNSAVTFLIESFLFKKNIKRSILSFTVIILLIVSCSIYGIFRYNEIMKISSTAPKAKIGMVQGNYSGIDKVDISRTSSMIIDYNELSNKILNYNPDLIVWPETAIPLVFDIEVENYDLIKKFSKVPLLTGIHMSEIDIKRQKEYFYNSLILISGDKKKLDYYHKIKLLPFAERIPIPFFGNILNLLKYEEFSPGKEYKIMKVNNIKFTPNICYEIIIPLFIRKSLNKDGIESNLIINATNDSWYGRTIEPKIHYRMAGFRTIEYRKSLVRSTCTGYSIFFNPAGDIKYQSPLFQKDWVVFDVPLLEINTFYRQWGYLFPYLLLFLLLIILFYSFYKKISFKIEKSKIIDKTLFKRDLIRKWRD